MDTQNNPNIDKDNLLTDRVETAHRERFDITGRRAHSVTLAGVSDQLYHLPELVNDTIVGMHHKLNAAKLDIYANQSDSNKIKKVHLVISAQIFIVDEKVSQEE